METQAVLFAFMLTLFAGLSTGLGSLIAFFSKGFNPKFLAGSLGFSAGVMIYVSFVEIFAKAQESLAAVLGSQQGTAITVAAFFGGIALIALIDWLVPDFGNPHEIKNINPEHEHKKDHKKLLRMGMFSALAIAIHNFPEGLVTFMGALHDPALGVTLAIAIALHNIPEGVAIATPLYYATKSKIKTFLITCASGLAEPMGALLGYFILLRFFHELTFGVLFAGVAGIMVYISLDELLPTAEEFGEHHIAIGGVISGMLLMALSLVLLG